MIYEIIDWVFKTNKPLELDKITDDQQTRMCDICEDFIIEGSSCTQFFMCEGRFCGQALDYLQDEIDDEIWENRWYRVAWRWIASFIKTTCLDDITYWK